MSSSSSPAATLQHPEEPTVDVFIGDIVERPVKRRSTTGGPADLPLRPVATMPRGLGFPAIDPNKSYGLRPEATATAADGAHDAADTSQSRGGSAPAPASGVQGVGRTKLSTSTSGGVSLLVGPEDLATMHSSSFYEGVSYPLPPSLMHHLLHSHNPAAATAPAPLVMVHGAEFLALVLKVLQSSIPHHRGMALDVLLREFQRNDNNGHRSDATATTMHRMQGCQNYFLFGPHCATRVRTLVACLSQAAPKEAVKVMEVLSMLCGTTSNTTRDISDATSELSVPLADVSVQQDDNDDVDLDDDDAVSELLRLDLPRGLNVLGLPHTILHVGLAPEQWLAVAAVPAPEARLLFWQMLTVCSAVPQIAIAFATSRFVRNAMASTIEGVLLGQDNLHDPSTMALLRCLLRMCHVRPAAVPLADMLRPLLKLLFGIIVVGENATTARRSVSPPHHADPEADKGVAAIRVVAQMHLFLILRNFVRCGCSGVVAQFSPEIIALTQHGSLGALEMILLTDDGAGSKSLSAEAIDMVAQQSFRELYRIGDARNLDVTANLLLESTALQFWATYLGSEGIGALRFLGSASEIQTAMQKLLASHIITADALRNLFPTPQQHRSHTSSLINGRRRQCADDAAAATATALQISLSYNLVRFLASVQRVLPATRTAVVGFFDAAAMRLVESIFTARHDFRTNSRTEDDAYAFHVAGGQVLHAPLTVEELSMAMEMVECLNENGGGTRVSAAVGCVLLDVIAKTKQCTDSAVLVARWLLATSRRGSGGEGVASCSTEEEEEDAVDIARAVIGGDTRGAASPVDPATSTAGWMTALLSVARRPGVCARILQHAVTCHPAARYLFRWESLFADLLLWSVSPAAATAAMKEDRKGSEALLDAMLALSRVALTEGHLLGPGPAQHVAATLSTYANAAAERRLPLYAVAGISTAILVLPPEGCLACLRMLGETHDTFSWTRQRRREDGADTATYFDVLFQQQPAVAPTHAANAATPWLLQHIVDVLQVAIPLYRAWARDAWPRVAVAALVKRLVLKSRGASEFERSCVAELLEDMQWKEGQDQDAEGARDGEGWHGDAAMDDDDDEFEFSS